MKLKGLEKLNLSDNKISEISSLENITIKCVRYLYLENNNINYDEYSLIIEKLKSRITFFI